MNTLSPSHRDRRIRAAIPITELRRLHGKVLESAWDPSTRRAYRSHLASYLNFIKLHELDPNPTSDTLALFIVFMSQSIKPTSVEVYLTGIVHYLSPIYPEIRVSRSSPLVKQTLIGCKKLYNTPITRKRALLPSEVERAGHLYSSSPSYDNLLFISMLLCGFFGLLRLGELTYPNDATLDSPRKMSQRHTLQISATQLSFRLPYHKADRFYEGNTVCIFPNPTSINPIDIVKQYVTLRDSLFPHLSDLWIRSNGSRPRRNWFIIQLRQLCGASVGGHSIRAGGATALAQLGVPLQHIQAAGRWSSEAFRIYIRQHPLILHNLTSHANTQ